MSFVTDTSNSALRHKLSLLEAQRKIMDLIARQAQTEKQLRDKLQQGCETEVLEKAIAWAQAQEWFATPELLAEVWAEKLNRRGQGAKKINQKLAELGLAEMSVDPGSELAKARKLVLAKWSPDDFTSLEFSKSQQLKAKVMRFLQSRGFDLEIVETIMIDELKAGALSHDEE